MKSWRKWLLGGLLVWIGVVTWWALTPISNTVPAGAIPNRDGVPVATAVTVQCAAPLSGSDEPTDPLPTLAPPRKLQRAPCASPRENARLMYAVDLVLVIVVLVVLIRTWKPTTEEPELEDASVPA